MSKVEANSNSEYNLKQYLKIFPQIQNFLKIDMIKSKTLVQKNKTKPVKTLKRQNP